jgi:hypothetical protein
LYQGTTLQHAEKLTSPMALYQGTTSRLRKNSVHRVLLEGRSFSCAVKPIYFVIPSGL